MAEVKILKALDVPSGDPTRLGKQDVMVVYSIDGGPGLMTTFPKEEESDERLKQAIKEHQERIKSYENKSFSLE